MSFLKKNWINLLMSLILVAGILLLVYPSFADWWNSWNAARIVNNYNAVEQSLSNEDRELVWKQAEEYNRERLEDPDPFNPTEEEDSEYQSVLDISGNGVMGVIEVPVADISLPVYHGTSEEVLQVGAGHLEGSSLPIGGIGTHTVITGHRGLPSAKLFTSLDQVKEKDYFILRVLGKTLTYQVKTIRIVDPVEVEGLYIDPDKDQLTLVTCTPYGVNTHRMLLTGERVENLRVYDINSDADLVDSNLTAMGIAVPVLIGLFLYFMFSGSKKTKGERK